MGYLDEVGLARYDDLIKSWVIYNSGTVQGVTSTLNWQKTSTAGAVTCYPVPAAPLEPVVNFAFTETLPDGDKSPTNPSTITGMSSVSVGRCGKNCLTTADAYAVPGRGITATVNADGSVSIVGTTSGNGIVYWRAGGTSASNIIAGSPFISGMAYTISMTCADSNVKGFVHYSTDGGSNWVALVQALTGGNSSTFTIPSGTTGFQVWTQITTGTVLNTTVKFQVELGSTATTFEPYSGNDYTINLGNTYYGGTLDLATGLMTVTHAAVTPDASTVDISSAPAAMPLDCTDTYGRTITSTDGTSLAVGSTGGTIVYKLATPSEVELTPTQISSLTQSDKYTPRLNTVYSDQVSVQVGYPKSPIQSELDLTNAIISLGGNV